MDEMVTPFLCIYDISSLFLYFIKQPSVIHQL